MVPGKGFLQVRLRGAIWICSVLIAVVLVDISYSWEADYNKLKIPPIPKTPSVTQPKKATGEPAVKIERTINVGNTVTETFRASGTVTWTSSAAGRPEVKETFVGELKGAGEWLILEPHKSRIQAVIFSKPKILLPRDTLSRVENPGGRDPKVLLKETGDPAFMKAIMPLEGDYFFVGGGKPKFSERGEFKFEKNEPLIWCEGAIHVLDSPLTFPGYRFLPDKGNFLSFQVDLNRGYVFIDGKGVVEILNDSVFVDASGVKHAVKAGTVVLDSANKGFAVGTGR